MTELEIFMDPNLPDDRFPQYQTAGAAGFDLAAWVPGDYAGRIIRRNQSRIISTGLYFMIPEGFEVQTRSRSGLAFKHGIFVLNAPGTIDCDYRGEIRVILQNLGPADYIIRDGDRIAQGVLKPAPQAKLKRVVTIRHDTARGTDGEGSTGR